MSENRNYILLISLFFLALLVFFLDKIASENYYYWTIWWYDIMMHFLGGFLVAGLALWMYARFFKDTPYRARHVWYVAIGAGVIVGIGWEVFEYLTGALIQTGVDLVIDTILDLVMDTVGAFVAWMVLKKPLFKQPQPVPETHV